MGNEGKGKRRGREFTIHSNSVTRIGLTNERARGPCAERIDRCHASIVWLDFTRESGARSTLELEHTQGWGRK